tara:strand:+ start:551 stop:1615 length:1065 start_codon:yes stop_codon:yes gene_type:complete
MPTEPLTEVAAEIKSTDESIVTLTVGDILQQERQRLGLDEKEVADQLHITMHYVKALESNSYEKLPGAVFARGYLKSYALLLGLDVENLVSRYDECAHQQKTENEEEKRVLRARKKKDRNKPLVIISLIIFVVGFLGLWLVNSYFADDSASEVTNNNESIDDSETIRSVLSQVDEPQLRAQPQLTLRVEPEEIPAATQLSTIVPSPATELDAELITDSESAERIESDESSEPEASPEIEDLTATLQALRAEQAVNAELIANAKQARLISIEAIGSDILRIHFTGESWIEVNDSDSQQIYRDIRVAGDVLEITGSAPFNILLGDARFAQMSLNGDEIDLSSDIRIDNSARLTVGL